MDFGETLKEWEKNQEQNRKRKQSAFSAALERYLPDDDAVAAKEKRPGGGPRSERAEARSLLKRMRPEGSLDLHGCTVSEALDSLCRFLADSRRDGLKKVLIVHGKGIHSKNTSVLGGAVRTYLERSAVAGEFGYADRQSGGRGATWVILK